MQNVNEIRQCDINTTGPNTFGKLLLGKSAKEQDALEAELRKKDKQYGELIYKK